MLCRYIRISKNATLDRGVSMGGRLEEKAWRGVWHDLTHVRARGDVRPYCHRGLSGQRVSWSKEIATVHRVIRASNTDHWQAVRGEQRGLTGLRAGAICMSSVRKYSYSVMSTLPVQLSRQWQQCLIILYSNGCLVQEITPRRDYRRPSA